MLLFTSYGIVSVIITKANLCQLQYHSPVQIHLTIKTTMCFVTILRMHPLKTRKGQYLWACFALMGFLVFQVLHNGFPWYQNYHVCCFCKRSNGPEFRLSWNPNPHIRRLLRRVQLKEKEKRMHLCILSASTWCADSPVHWKHQWIFWHIDFWNMLLSQMKMSSQVSVLSQLLELL